MARKVKRVRVHLPYYDFMAILKGRNIKLQELSDLLGGMAVQTISAKNHGWAEYSMTEIDTICSRYGISSEIFRTKKVS